MAKTKKAKNLGRKVGRSKVECAAYKGRRQRERNKVVKIARHLRKVGTNDRTAVKALKQAYLAVHGI